MTHITQSQLPLALNVGQLHLEHEGGAARDLLPGAGVAVAEVGGDHQLPLLSDTHPQQALVPSLDNLNMMNVISVVSVSLCTGCPRKNAR